MISKRLFSIFTNSFKTAGWSIKNPNFLANDDSYLYTSKLLAVCDAQSSWKSKGIDSGKQSWQLVENLEKSYNFLPEAQKYFPQEVLKQALKQTTEIGSSTCTLAIIHPEKPEISIGSIGDSGLLILRKSGDDVVLIFQTPEVVHSFDKPFVVGTDGNSIEEGFYKTFEIKDRDLVLLYTDGISHNMFTDQIIRMVKPFMLLHEIPDLEIIAEMVAEKALLLCEDGITDKPYGIQTNNHNIGKINDATVVIGEISIKNIN